MRRLISASILLLVGLCLHAEVAFSSLDLSPSNQLLFSATTDTPDWGPHRVLLTADLSGAASTDRSVQAVAGGDVLDDISMRQLTFFPEIMTYLPELDAVQIQNRFGLFRGSVDTGRFDPVDGFESFVDGAVVSSGRIVPVTASPDGRYLVPTPA